MKDTTETVSNLKNQISKTGKSVISKVRGQGQYSKLAQSDYNEPIDMKKELEKINKVRQELKEKEQQRIPDNFEDLALKLNRLSRKKQKQLDEYNRLKNNVAKGRIEETHNLDLKKLGLTGFKNAISQQDELSNDFGQLVSKTNEAKRQKKALEYMNGRQEINNLAELVSKSNK